MKTNLNDREQWMLFIIVIELLLIVAMERGIIA